MKYRVLSLKTSFISILQGPGDVSDWVEKNRVGRNWGERVGARDFREMETFG